MTTRAMFLALLATMTPVGAARASAAPATRPAALGDGFAAGDLSAFVRNAGELKPGQAAWEPADGAAGKRRLRLADGARAVLADVPVDPDTKYALTFRARFDGSEAVEENPRLDVLAQYGAASPVVPRREVQFLDADRKPLGGGLTAGMPLRNWHAYRDAFYPPAKAAFARVALAAGKAGVTLYVEDLSLAPAADEGAINVNPVIGAHGRYDYSGWGPPAAGGKIIETDDGRVAFDTKYGTRGPTFPLARPGTYSLSARSTANGYNSVVILDLLDDGGKTVESISLRRYDRPTTFILPPGVRRGSFLVYSNLLEEVRVVRAGDVD